jgi:hypothetical protein
VATVTATTCQIPGALPACQLDGKKYECYRAAFTLEATSTGSH